MEIIVLFAMVVGLMLIGVPIAVSLGMSSILFLLVLGDTSLASIAQTFFQAMAGHYTLLAIPFFILASAFMSTGGVAKRIIRFSIALVGHLPGGLAIAGVFACMLFAALSGSSPATVVAIGSIVIVGMREVGYTKDFAAGVIAVAGTLGILIPPSVNLIIYGALTGTSIGQLFAAGIVPGLLLTGLFMLTIAIISLLLPSVSGKLDEPATLSAKMSSLRHLLPPLSIFVVVMVTIYAGWGTPTEAAAVGVLMAFGLAAVNRALSISMLHDAFLSTVRTTAMILLIIIAAFYLKFIIGILGVPQAMTSMVAAMDLSPLGFIFVLVIFYLVLGCFIETLSMMVGTIPIIFPLVLHMGFDPVWFGIFLVLMMELALITPPVGMNLFVVQGVRRTGSVIDVFYGIIPFVGAVLFAVALIVAFPEIVTWLPNRMF